MATPEAIGTRISKWGEGPVWSGDRLLYVDIEGKAIVRLDPDEGTESILDVGQRVGFAVPCRSGRLLFGGDHGLFFLDPATGETTPIHDPEPDLAANRFNDGKCSPDGRLFAGTIATDKATGAARLYRLDPDLGCSVVYRPVTNSNGLAWSGDGRTLYYIDTPSKEVKAFAYDAGNGTLDCPRRVVDCSREEASPDGMTIDAEDRLWIALCHGGRVARFDPASGEKLEEIALPARETTSCCFGGPNHKDLFVTTGRCPARPGDQGGRVFVIRGLPVGGRPVVSFEDADA
jgi:sugar lactone lactonase YvrE